MPASGTFALIDAMCYLGGHDFTGDSNRLSLTAQGEQLDSTNFRSNRNREYKMGLKTSTLDLAGFWQAAATDAVDPETWNNLGSGGRVTTIGATETEGVAVGMVQAMQADYHFGGTIGQLAPYSLQGVCSDGYGIIHGKLLKAMGAVSATGATGTGVQIGAVGATQYLYATFHVFSAGTTITAVVESDDNSGFTSATTRYTFGPITTAGGTWATRVAGAITDDWWRVRVTAITGTFVIACAAGIQ